MATVGTEMDEVRREAVKCPSWVTLRPKRPCRTRVPAGRLRLWQQTRHPSALSLKTSLSSARLHLLSLVRSTSDILPGKLLS